MHAANGVDRVEDVLVVVRRGERQRQHLVTGPLGAIDQRTLLQTRFERSFPGFADGDYALVLFRSAFAKRQDVRESVTLEREADGRWRVIGYALR